VRYDVAAAALRAHYPATGERNLEEAAGWLTHLDRFFAGRRLASIGPADAIAYAAARQGRGAANGTINRELAVLGRMLRLAYEHGTLLRLPILRKLKEAPPPREGFFEPAAYLAVRRRLPEDLQLAVTIAYTFGWRMRSEVVALAAGKWFSTPARSGWSPAARRTMTAASCTSRPSSKPCWRATSSASRPWSAASGASCPCCSHTSRADGLGRRGESFGKRGRRRARRRGARGCSAMISDARRCATSSGRACRTPWP